MYKTFYEQKECVAFIEWFELRKNSQKHQLCESMFCSPSKVTKNLKNHCRWITIFLLSKATKPEEPFRILMMLELSGTTIVSPRGFFPLSLAPKRLRTREWRHSQSCRRQMYLCNLETKVTCVRSDSSHIWSYCTQEINKNAYGPPALQLISKFAVIVIPKDVNQLARVAKLPARLLMLTGRIYKRQSFEVSLQIAYSLCLRALALELWIWTVLFSGDLKLGERHLVRYLCYALRYHTSDIMIHGMAPIPKEKAMA
jgi:hypothetical protein